MESEDRSLKFIMFISFLGLIDALYLSYLHHLISQGAGCPTENLPGLDCGVVLASEQAKLFGIPVAWLGVVGFLMLIGLSLDRYLNMDLERTYYNKILLPFTGVIGVGLLAMGITVAAGVAKGELDPNKDNVTGKVE